MVSHVKLLLCLLCLASSVNAQQLRDPTRPANAPALKSKQGLDALGFSQVRVTAVFVSGQRKTAIINGQRVSEGQRWNGMRVAKIHSKGVVLKSAKNYRKEFLVNNVKFLKESSNDS